MARGRDLGAVMFGGHPGRIAARAVVALHSLLYIIALSLLARPLWSQIDTAGVGYVQVRLVASDSDSSGIVLTAPSREDRVRLSVEPFLTLEQVERVAVSSAGNGEGYRVLAELTPEGDRIFRRVTAGSVGRMAAVIVGARITVLATIRDELSGPIPLTDDSPLESEARALVDEVNGRLRRIQRDPRREGDRNAMQMQNEGYGRPNSNAPKQLSGFDFLIGRWLCESRVKNPDGGYTTHRAVWEGRYVLDGYVIADEFRQFDEDGNVIQLGRNYRAYDVERGAWAMKWLDALNGTWLDLGPEELGGVAVRDASIVFKHHRPPGPAEELFPAHTIFRITFFDISDDGFSWRAEVSTDSGETWEEVQVIEARRAEDGPGVRG